MESRKPESNEDQDKKPIPLKWVFIAILAFVLAYHVTLLLSGNSAE